MPKVQVSKYEKVKRALDVMDRARNNSPYENAVASGVTLTVNASSDGTLAAAVPLATGNALTSAGLNQVAWFGGVPVANNSVFVAMPVMSESPGNGNLQSLVNASWPFITADMSMWNHAAEIETDSDTVEFAIYTSSNRKVLFQVDGAYVNKTGDAGAAGNAISYYKLVFTSRKKRLIRVIMSNRYAVADAATMMTAIRIKST